MAKKNPKRKTKPKKKGTKTKKATKPKKGTNPNRSTRYQRQKNIEAGGQSRQSTSQTNLKRRKKQPKGKRT